MKRWIAILVFAVFSFAACNKNNIPQDYTPVVQIINAKQYLFKAETANPMGGTAIRLSYGYDLVVKPGEIIATLPYYGRAYVADPNFTGMRFTSKKFTYNSSSNGKGGWDIIVRPADVPDVQEMQLSISEEGYGTLYITSTNRQPISYYGRIQKA